jgi:hypothetical protein
MSDQENKPAADKPAEAKPDTPKPAAPATVRRRTPAPSSAPAGTGFSAPRRKDPADPAKDPFRHGERVWPD